MATVMMVVVRPLHYRGEPYPSGVRLDVTPLEAFDMLASGRASLADAADLAKIKKAVDAQTALALRGSANHAPAGGPWRPAR